MKTYSYAFYEGQYIPVEINITLVKGLPVVQFTGAVDSVLKDSIPRIKSAIRRSGFEWPSNSQILFHIRPNNFKKVSFGLDLALAYAVLVETEQIQAIGEDIHFYGELGFDGEVIIPEGLSSLPKVERLITAIAPENLFFSSEGMISLQNFRDLDFIVNEPRPLDSVRPPLPNIKFSEAAAKALAVIAVGEHPTMLAGPAGSGKSTFSENLYYLQSDPEIPMMGWRPKVQPHHSIPMRSFIGGGYPLVAGELSRANQGLLILDEYLEFNKQVQESLRGPLEQGHLELNRRGQIEIYPCKMQLVATTNLCPCGDLSPLKGKVCNYALFRCKSVADRLSGPVLDRFDLLFWSDGWGRERVHTLQDILSMVERARLWRKAQGRTSAVQYNVQQLETQIEGFTLQNLMPNLDGSERRRRALLRVARSFADLELSEKILERHIREAEHPSLHNFTGVRKLFA